MRAKLAPEIYLRAAELLTQRKYNHACPAIEQAFTELIGLPVSDAHMRSCIHHVVCYNNLFAPRHPEEGANMWLDPSDFTKNLFEWGNMWGNDPQDQRNCRVFALIFAAYCLPEIHHVDKSTSAQRILRRIQDALARRPQSGQGIPSNRATLLGYLQERS